MKPTSAICETDSKMEGYFTTKLSSKLRVTGEIMQERITKNVGNLQYRTQHHGKEEKDGHAWIFKQHEGIQTQLAGKRRGRFFSATGILGKVSA